MKFLVLLFILVSYSNVVFSKVKADSVSVGFKVKSLIRSKSFAQAKTEIDKLKDEELKSELLGLYYTKKNKPLKANRFFKKAYEINPLDRTVLQLSQNFLKAKEIKKALHWVNKVVKPSVASKILKSEALSLLGHVDEAVDTLNNTQKKSSKNIALGQPDLEKQKYKVLFSGSRIKSLFYHVSLYLKRHPQNAEPAIFALYLLKDNDRFLAQNLFDKVLSLTPRNALVLKEMAVFELESKNIFLAAHYFKRAVAIDPKKNEQNKSFLY